jgi:hypothetical protein
VGAPIISSLYYIIETIIGTLWGKFGKEDTYKRMWNYSREIPGSIRVKVPDSI